MAIREFHDDCVACKFDETCNWKTFSIFANRQGSIYGVNGIYSNVENYSQIFAIKIKPWHKKQGDCDLTTNHDEMLTLRQELDLYYNNKWERSTDSAKCLRK